MLDGNLISLIIKNETFPACSGERAHHKAGRITRMIQNPGRPKHVRPKYKYVLHLGDGENRIYRTKREAQNAKMLRNL